MNELWLDDEPIKLSFMLDHLLLEEERTMSYATDERYRKIIESARDIFSKFGYKGTTVDRIAKNAGIGKGTIYLFFETKEDILNAILDVSLTEMVRQAEEIINSEGDIKDRMYRAIYTCISFRGYHTIADRLAEELQEFGTVASQNALCHIDSVVNTAVCRLLEQAVAQKLILPIANVQLTALVLIHMYDAMTVHWEKDHEPLSNDEVFEMLHKFLT
ncbi:TetR/AcrR family transcriptional regulator [Paenibacillus campi]|uniref:TetR/AcrR family transcriptional regulator n=1 Tax=Paenibacillus campi TaxID=3106031 RepID=UPI002AFEB80F|nr:MULTISPECIES: TetR/AcrR family transcriptional regulator [unclassified Paenibacillus]